ncbi:ABC transporter ATP-binding protein [Massilia niabensis]|uniref:ABC transporter ATP-binding protein n=1 Tax=Massilia niabensis TaxID=544910 RepID=A0ABW0L0I4_9BURK
MSLFTLHGLVKRFGGLLVTDHVDLHVERGEIHALIGPNGAGKTTLVNLISGVLDPDEGRVLLDGVELTGKDAYERVACGLSRCFQITSIFPKASVRDNLKMALQAHTGHSFQLFASRAGNTALAQGAEALALRCGLEASLDQIAGNLPHGVQRTLDVALALAANPKLLLLDEPMAGMGPHESARMLALIESLRGSMAILLIEHDMDAVFALADRISVLVYGKVLVSGNADTIKNDPQVQAVYLGDEAGSDAAIAALAREVA